MQKARENDPETLYKIGDAYYKKKKNKKAFPWFHKAALQNHAEAQARVGYMYLHKQGVSRDYRQAMEWSMKAASADNAEAQYLVSGLYYCGLGVSSTDDKQATYWCLKAAYNGNKDAMKEIGDRYEYGFGVTESIHAAIEWYTKAANHGNERAQYYLGKIYRDKDSVRDLQKAVNWCQKAADNNDWMAKKEVIELNEQGYYAKEEEQEGILINA
jgi:TPR repeat protein